LRQNTLFTLFTGLKDLFKRIR